MNVPADCGSDASRTTEWTPTRRVGRRGRWKGRVLAGVLALSLSIPCVGWARDLACDPPKACLEQFPLATGGSIPIFRSRSLTPDASVERAVLVIHGQKRDADRYFGALSKAAALETQARNTLLIAPRFQTLEDDPLPGQPYWSSSGWKIGNRSRDSTRVSSFSVLDELLETICPADRKKFSRLETVVIVGHSAGGQFVQRYAAGGAGCANPSTRVRYVVMNPSSYLYPDERRRANGQGPFRKNRFGCWKYNEYKYGLEDLNAYMQAVGKDRLRAQLFSRSVHYLAGDADNQRDSSSLDKSCEGNLQGPERLSRHRNYRDYSGLFDDWRGSVFLTVPGIGHNGRKMLESETARRIVFR